VKPSCALEDTDGEAQLLCEPLMFEPRVVIEPLAAGVAYLSCVRDRMTCLVKARILHSMQALIPASSRRPVALELYLLG